MQRDNEDLRVIAIHVLNIVVKGRPRHSMVEYGGLSAGAYSTGEGSECYCILTY